MVKPTPPGMVLVKFFGGLLAMGSDLALGREGPTVQMGASLSSLISRFLVKQDVDTKVVMAAGAGLAVAFNAPISGSVFVFEELTSTFNPWLLMGTLAAATFAVWTMRFFPGNHLDFVVRLVSPTAARGGLAVSRPRCNREGHWRTLQLNHHWLPSRLRTLDPNINPYSVAPIGPPLG